MGAVVGGLASAYGASKSNKASKGAGKVDVYHEVKPYGDSGWYKDQIAQKAYENIFGKPPAPGVGTAGPQNPSHMPPGGPGLNPGTGGRPGQEGVPDQYGNHLTPEYAPATTGKGKGKGKGGKGKGGKGGGGGAGAGKTPGSTQTAIDNAMRVAGEMEKSPVTTAAKDYTTSTLGGEDRNPYRTETAEMLRGINDTGNASNYQRLLDELWGSETGLGGGSGSGSSQKTGQNVRYGMSSTDRAKVRAAEAGQVQAGVGRNGQPLTNPNDPGGRGMVGIEQNLESLLAGDDSPAMQGMREKIKRQGDEALAEQQKALRLRAAGSGNYGGTGQDYAEGTAMGRYGGYLADANAQMYSDLYGQALGLGTQYDISAQDRAAQERMNSENVSASSSASGAALQAAADDRASREKMQRLSMLGDLTGMGLDMDKFQASGFGSLGEGFSGDQRNALSLAGDTNAMGQTGWLNAGGLSLGRDQSQNQLRASLAGTGVQRQALQWEKDRYAREAPMRDLTQLGGLMSGLYDPYATTHDFGFDGRSQSPSYSNPIGQGLAGAAAGYSLGKDMGW